MKKLFLMGAVLLSFLACGEKKSNQETISVDTEAGQVEKVTYVSSERLAIISDPTIAGIYDEYNKLKTAFVNTDAMTVKQIAVELLKSSGPELEETGIRKPLSGMAETDDIEEQRKHLPALTGIVKQLLADKMEKGSLFYQYCPMAFNGKGAHWISNEEKIRNPYFGDKMLGCGVVEEELIK